MDLFNINMSEQHWNQHISWAGALYVSARHKAHGNDLMAAMNKWQRHAWTHVGHIL